MTGIPEVNFVGRRPGVDLPPTMTDNGANLEEDGARLIGFTPRPTRWQRFLEVMRDPGLIKIKTTTVMVFAMGAPLVLATMDILNRGVYSLNVTVAVAHAILLVCIFRVSDITEPERMRAELRRRVRRRRGNGIWHRIAEHARERRRIGFQAREGIGIGIGHPDAVTELTFDEPVHHVGDPDAPPQMVPYFQASAERFDKKTGRTLRTRRTVKDGRLITVEEPVPPIDGMNFGHTIQQIFDLRANTDTIVAPRYEVVQNPQQALVGGAAVAQAARAQQAGRQRLAQPAGQYARSQLEETSAIRQLLMAGRTTPTPAD